MTQYLVDRAYQLNKQIKCNINQCELVLMQWLIEDSMATLLAMSDTDASYTEVFPDDFICTVPATMQVGQRVTIQPTFIPNTTTNKSTTCVSNDTSKLSVKTYGIKHELTALAEGTVTIGITSVVAPHIVHTYTIKIEPAPVVQQDNIWYGVIPASLGLKSFKSITSEMVKKYLTKKVANTLPKTGINFSAGDLVVAVVPEDRVAKKDDGFNNKVQFNSSAQNPDSGEYIHANGEVTLDIDDITYELYGEFMVVSSGNLFIYVD